MEQGLFKTTVTPAYIHHQPFKQTAPVIVESPHHSLYFPVSLTTRQDFELACDPIHAWRQEDTAIDRLIHSVVKMGLPVLEATVARCYIDLNRAMDSVHPDHISGTLTQLRPAANDFYAAAGLGLVRTLAYYGGDIRIVESAPTEDEILQRIERYWAPYHAQLDNMIAENVARFGESLHISCHSFPLSCMREKEALEGYTFFIGTADDTTADRSLKDFVIQRLEAMRFQVADNHILKGQELVKRHGRPDQGRHSLQIEIVRESYMHCETCQLHDGFQDIQEALSSLFLDVGAFMQERCQKHSPSFPSVLDQEFP